MGSHAYTGICPPLFLRYIDKCIGIASCMHADFVDFINFASNFHPALKLTCSISDTSIPFLDLSVSISGDGLFTDIYYKPTDSHSYLDYFLFPPCLLQKCYPLLTIPPSPPHLLSDDAFHSRTKEMSSFFKERGFPSYTNNSALKHISPISRTSTLTPSSHHPTWDRVPLVLTYHPTSLQVQRIILRNFRHLQRDSTTKHIFPSPPSAFHRDRSLRDSLVHSSPPPPSLPTDLPPGTYPCKRNKCYTCRYTSSLTTIQGPRQSFQVRRHFTCESAGAVYCVRCSRCGLLYIGETQRRLGDRFAEHLRSVCQRKQDLPVATHFNSTSHSHSDMSIHGLLYCQNESKLRLEEQHLIYWLGSLQPDGMNVDFSNFR
ncbi:uncharacterized protein LOC132391972 [Hypanus sabinus]|uniref:uncharacterized protein LOC132391972 n=1 Tax=Hypanus sabinus TaxID=79690 RepID=UPI0028C3DDE2|nr:uncharacterized protein LOC132391972 [Hypanus sabinus]XP_059821813.1 uncharacterized protein LOC132391972 [Hypanus sabinus]